MKSTKGEREGGEIFTNFHNLKKNEWMNDKKQWIFLLSDTEIQY